MPTAQADTQNGATAYFNMLDLDQFAGGHPHAAYDLLRSTDPVHLHPGGPSQPPFHVLTSHADVQAVSRDTRRFSSANGFNLAASGENTAASAVLKALGRNILTYDPPEHGEFKHILMPAFMPARLRLLEERIQTFVAELLESLEGRTEVEFVSEVASAVPIRALCELLGVPPEDEPKILTWTNRMVGAEDPDMSANIIEAQQAFFEVFAYGKWLVEKRRAEPRDDLMSLIAHGTLAGEPLSDATRDGMCATLFAAGNETTRNALTGSVMLLTQYPDQRARLVADAELISDAVEEILRHTSPVIHMVRTAVEDVPLRDKTIAAGERVALLYGAANHDPVVFENPHALDFRRSNARLHLAFGTGIHHCIGARLAQIELRVLLTELLRRYPDISATGDAAYLRSNFVCGVKRLPVRLAR